ncbi:hypothetical protein DLAC_01950 [Tieghemostelium lacteum]|uniref:EGF-like domain-containing protein n=1 Tax=Tieghemostelium lacteum TaxID=361077 RepID=A0A152A543_TIELA|nr:hypothetical protein DLAC_01950 [Tieghemostelium lacteum]|eukprot:KYR01362.1 hypothetical protein DLAC_01950 [Tieghemostelium lacteum]
MISIKCILLLLLLIIIEIHCNINIVSITESKINQQYSDVNNQCNKGYFIILDSTIEDLLEVQLNITTEDVRFDYQKYLTNSLVRLSIDKVEHSNVLLEYTGYLIVVKDSLNVTLNFELLMYKCIPIPTTLNITSGNNYNNTIYNSYGLWGAYSTMIEFNNIDSTLMNIPMDAYTATGDFFGDCIVKKVQSNRNSFLLQCDPIKEGLWSLDQSIDIYVIFNNQTSYNWTVSSDMVFEKLLDSGNIEITSEFPYPSNRYSRVYMSYDIHQSPLAWSGIVTTLNAINLGIWNIPNQRFTWPIYTSRNENNELITHYIFAAFLSNQIIDGKLLVWDGTSVISQETLATSLTFQETLYSVIPNSNEIQCQLMATVYGLYTCYIEHTQYQFGMSLEFQLKSTITNNSKIIKMVDSNLNVIGKKQQDFKVLLSFTTTVPVNIIYLDKQKEVSTSTIPSSDYKLQLSRAISTRFNNTHFRVSVETVSDNDIRFIQICGQKSFRISVADLVRGNLKDGVFEKFLPNFICLDQGYLTIQLWDAFNNFNEYNDPMEAFLSSSNEIIYLPTVPNAIDGDFEFSKFHFENNPMTLSNDNVNHNRIYFNLTLFNNTNAQLDEIVPMFIPIYRNGIKPLNTFESWIQESVEGNLFTGKWNENYQMFTIDFTLPSNLNDASAIDYLLYLQPFIHESALLYHLMGTDSQLIIVNPNGVMDQFPPLVPIIEPYPSDDVTLQSFPEHMENKTIGFNIYIQENYNGFQNGKITIIDSQDFQLYQYEFTKWDMEVNATHSHYPLRFQISNNCGSLLHQYNIYSITLWDKHGFKSDLMDIYSINPFLKFDHLDDSVTLNVQCQDTTTNDNTPPDLTDFSIIDDISSLALDVFTHSGREIKFSLTVQDSQSGVSPIHNPWVTLSSEGLDDVQCHSILGDYQLDSSSRITKAKYTCSLFLPYGYGYPNTIVVSVHNLVDNSLNFNAMSASDIVSQYDILFTTNTSTLLQYYQPYIESYSEITVLGGDLILYGYRFGTDKNKFLINATRVGSISVKSLSSNSVVFNISESLPIEFPFQIGYDNGVVGGKLYSNTISVNPVYSIPLNTKKPLGCSGDPVCGGPGIGQCIDNQCVCENMYSGDACLGTIQPMNNLQFNSTSPMVSMGYQSYEDDEYYSMQIELIKLVEFSTYDSRPGSIEYSFSELNWQFHNDSSDQANQIDSGSGDSSVLSYRYTTTLNNSISTNISVTLQYYPMEKNFSFGDTQQTIKKQSIKFQVAMDQFPYRKKQNQLSLIYKASIHSDNGICSQSIHRILSPKMESMTMKINDKVLYSRFLSYAEIDGDIKTIGSDFHTRSTYSDEDDYDTKEVVNYVTVSVPYYEKSAKLDPDFILLKDQYFIDNNEEATTCLSVGEEKKPLLSKAGIAGVIVGAVILLALIGAVVAYIFIKGRQVKKQSKLLHQNFTEME